MDPSLSFSGTKISFLGVMEKERKVCEMIDFANIMGCQFLVTLALSTGAWAMASGL